MFGRRQVKRKKDEMTMMTKIDVADNDLVLAIEMGIWIFYVSTFGMIHLSI